METDLFRKTMKSIGVMVGACALFTGMVTLIALFVVGRAVGPRESVEQGSGVVPASKIDGQRPPKADDAPPPKSNANKADLPPRATRAI